MTSSTMRHGDEYSGAVFYAGKAFHGSLLGGSGVVSAKQKYVSI
ncbi:hypothetical protein N9F31_03805 [Pseudomonadales bacterium]|nr:hypothetical protein [Pseudomonadales bacterium]